MIETTYVDPAQNGRVGVIVPHGVLFRGGSEGRIRQALIEENLLDAVIGLPENLFYGTGIPAAILIFKRNRLDDRVIFIDASQEYEAGTNQNKLRLQDRTRVVSTYRARDAIYRYAYIATAAEISANAFNLNIARYVDKYEEEDSVDLRMINQQLAQLASELSLLETKMQGYLEELGLNE